MTDFVQSDLGVSKILSMSQDINRLGTRLREERLRLGLSQAGLAELCDVSRATLSAYELGTHEPGAKFLAALHRHSGDALFVVTGSRLQRLVDENIDWQLISDLLVWIDEWAATRNKPTLPETRARLIELAYSFHRESGQDYREILDRVSKVAG